MSGDHRIVQIASPSSYQEYDHHHRPQHIITVSVIGLSGPDSIKGAAGVGKSVLCNRLVRPEFENFYVNHITHLSQADFSGSPVINNDHWLYWGEAELDSDYHGKTTHIRFIEQTEFIDDETFEPLRSSRQPTDYLKRAIRINLESHDKLMYICRDQLGAESAFEARTLPEGKTNVDAFLVVFDVSRLIPGQSEFISNIFQALNKTKRPIFVVATKCDSIKYYLEGMQELQKLLRKKEFKNVNQTIIETSAIQNVNISELLKFIAATLDKHKGKIKILPFEDAVEARTTKLKEIREDFINLIAQLLPREEWPRRQNQKQLNWMMLVKDFGVAAQPAYKYFTSAYGIREAERIYDEHINRSKEWWTAKEQREKLPALRNVLLEFFDSNSLTEAKWEDIAYKTKQHPMFDRYFKPVGQTLSRFTQHSQDARIPAELLQTYDAQHMFHELQKEISNKVVLDAQIERFISFLAHKDVIIPGRKYSDAKILVNEIETYEQFLPNGRAEQAYAEFQTYLITEAERNFVELLQERLPIFAAFALLKQKSSNPNLTVDAEFETYFSHALQDDRRFRQMNGLNERRRKLMQRFCNFIIHPLDDYCFSGSFCANKQLSKIIETCYPNYHKYFPVDIVIYGEDYLVDEFITAVNMALSVDRLFDYDSGLAKISCFKHSDPLTSSRIRSLICVVNSLDTVENFMGVKWKAAPGLPPLFVNASSSEEVQLQQHVSKIADKIGGVYISEDNLSLVETASIQSLTAHFHFDQIQRVLREVCHAQLCGIYADLRVQISFMCGDVFKPDVVLSMLLDQSNHTNSSGNVFTFDQHLPQEDLNIRIRMDTTAYHSWLLSPVGWPLNAINGHILVYSPLRIASWHHAEMAARMLVSAAGPNIDDQQTIGKSILILAVDDPGNYFSNKNSRLLLTLGNKLAEEIGASFATLSPNSGGVSQMELFVNYFELIFTNDALPESYYFPTMLAANLLTPQNPSISTSPASENRNREYTTLKSTGSSVSQESHDSGASVNGAFIGAFRTSTGRSITDTIESKPPASSPSSHGSSSQRSSNKVIPGSNHMSRMSMRSNHSVTSDMSSAPLAKPEFVEINNEFYYETPTSDTPTSYGPPTTATTNTTTRPTEKTTPTTSKQKKIEKLLPKFGRLMLEGSSSGGAGPFTVAYSDSHTDTPTTGKN
jgi:GTPase SAR1 family protein